MVCIILPMLNSYLVKLTLIGLVFSSKDNLILKTILVYDKTLKDHFELDSNLKPFLHEVIKQTGDRLLELDSEVWLDVIAIEYIDEEIIPSDDWIDYLGAIDQVESKKGILRSYFCLHPTDDAVGKFGDGNNHDNMCRPQAVNILSLESSADATACIFAHELGHGIGIG